MRDAIPSSSAMRRPSLCECSMQSSTGSPTSSSPSAATSSRFPRSEEHTSELQSLTNLVCRRRASPSFPYPTLFRSVLTGNRLVTVRYATPKPVRAFAEHARRDPELVRDASTVLVRMLDAIIDRLADELESVSGDIEQIS